MENKGHELGGNICKMYKLHRMSTRCRLNVRMRSKTAK